MRIDSGADTGGGAGSLSMGARFQQAMAAESGNSGPASASLTPAGATGTMSNSAQTAEVMQGLQGIMTEMKELIQQLAQLIQSMSNGGSRSSGASSIGDDGRTRSVDAPDSGDRSDDHSGHHSGDHGANGLGGSQGPSARIPDPTQNVREVQLGSKTMTIGSDGSASAAEVDEAASEMQRMYDTSPTFRQTIDSAGTDNLTVTLGRRDDNTSWGGGGRVFLNLNNIEAGNNDRFQGIVGHEFAHAAAGLGHGAELDSIEDRVRMEA